MLFLCQFLVDLALALAKAALGLSCLLLLALLLAQRKHLRLCLSVSQYLAKTLVFLALAGPLSTLGAFLLFVANVSSKGGAWQWPSPLNPAVLPYTVNIALWLLVPPLALWLAKRLGTSQQKLGQALVLSVVLVMLCFAAFFCLSWPFAGLPPGLKASQAFTAILMHTWHLAYFSLVPACITLLALVPTITRALSALQTPPQDITLVRRWLAGLGLVGAIPHCLNVWAVGIGYLLRPGQIPATIFQNLLENTLLTMVVLALTLALIHKWPKKTALFEGSALVFFLGFLAIPSLLSFLRTP